MKFSMELAVGFLALSNVQAFAVPPRSLYMGSLSSHSYRANPVRREARFESLEGLNTGGVGRREAQEQQQGQGGGGGLKIGGLTLGGPGGGISGPGLQLGGNRQGNSQQQQAGQESRNGTAVAGEETPAAGGEKAPATEGAQPQAGGSEQSAVPEFELSPAEAGAGVGTDNQPGRAEGEAAKLEAQQEAAAAEGEKSNDVKATEESERFSEEAGITLDGSGNAQNLGGNLGITKGTDGSTSVGGENGINVAANGQATVAGNE